MILERARDAYSFLYEQFNNKADEQEIKEYGRSESELQREIKKREAHLKEIRTVKKDMITAQNANPLGSIEDLSGKIQRVTV